MLNELFAAQREVFARQPFPAARERRKTLSRLMDALLLYKEQFAEAIDGDFGGRSRQEVMFS
jgi:coniferyl-aldehyde dehydrogenase